MRNNIGRKTVVIGLLVLLLGAGVALGSTATRDSKPVPMNRDNWFENFDSYEVGSALNGQGGWFCWDNLPINTGYITDVQSHSPSNSLDIKWNDQTNWNDMVHAFSGVNSGNWTIRAWLFIPSDMTRASDFILMNTYTNGTHDNAKDWSLQLEFNATKGTIFDLNDATKTLPIVKDAWAQIRVSINFEADLQTIYYNEQFFEHTSWKNHAGTNGAQNLAAIDLYSGAAYSTSVYWDDLSVLPPAEELTCEAGGPYNGNVGDTIHFTGTASGGYEPYTWLWDFGDESTSTDQNPTHVYTTPGNYSITLTVYDAIQQTATDTATATIIQVFEPELQITSLKGGFGISAVIKNTGTAPATDVQWTINVTGLVFPKAKSGSETSIAMGATATAAAKVLGLGSTTITVKATCAEGKSATKTATAKVFLFFVLGVA